jgi:endoglucanase
MKKRILSILLIIAVTLGSVPTTLIGSANAPASTVRTPVRQVGDVNGDGAVNITDVLEILKQLAKITSNEIHKGGSGSPAWNAALIVPSSIANNRVAIDDALEILKRLAGISNIIPVLTTEFRNMNAFDYVANMGPGWNLGNTFDAHGSPAWGSGMSPGWTVAELETMWLGGAGSGRETTRELLKSIKEQGFDTVRIPVTWYKVTDGNTLQIHPNWMARVKQVVDWAIAEDLYVILNTHHEEGVMSLLMNDRATTSNVVKKLWEQIAETFKGTGHKLIFEGLNEPRAKGVSGVNEWWGDIDTRETVNILNQVFVDTIRANGGNNRYRVLMVPTYAASTEGRVMRGFRPDLDDRDIGFIKPTDLVPDRLALSVHSYLPRAFGIGTNPMPAQSNFDPNSTQGGLLIVSTLADVADFAKDVDMPVVHGEYGSVRNNNADQSARANHAAFYVSEARKHGIGMVWWDSGRSDRPIQEDQNFGIIRRNAPHTAYFPEIVSAIVDAHNNTTPN